MCGVILFSLGFGLLCFCAGGFDCCFSECFVDDVGVLQPCGYRKQYFLNR